MKYSQLLRLLHQAGGMTLAKRGSHIKMKHPDRTDFIIVLNQWKQRNREGIGEKDQKAGGIAKAISSV